jgi:hypothetical protein
VFALCFTCGKDSPAATRVTRALAEHGIGVLRFDFAGLGGDDTVGIASATHIFAAAEHPKSLVSLADADHLLTRRADADYVAGLVAAWAARYLPPAAG